MKAVNNKNESAQLSPRATTEVDGRHLTLLWPFQPPYTGTGRARLGLSQLVFGGLLQHEHRRRVLDRVAALIIGLGDLDQLWPSISDATLPVIHRWPNGCLPKHGGLDQPRMWTSTSGGSVSAYTCLDTRR
jgi:hypothetical protein